MQQSSPSHSASAFLRSRLHGRFSLLANSDGNQSKCCNGVSSVGKRLVPVSIMHLCFPAIQSLAHRYTASFMFQFPIPTTQANPYPLDLCHLRSTYHNYAQWAMGCFALRYKYSSCPNHPASSKCTEKSQDRGPAFTRGRGGDEVDWGRIE